MKFFLYLLSQKQHHRVLQFVFLMISLHGISRCADFDVMMGKNTPHWKWLDGAEELAFLEECRSIYDHHPPKSNTSNVAPRIPTTVHFIWLGPKPFPAESVKNVRSWIAMNPKWKIKFWTDRDRPAPCSTMEVCQVQNFVFTHLRDRYEDTSNWGEKSDILRFEILFREGGVYVDHDANCIKTFEPLHNDYDFYCGLEPPHQPFAGSRITCGNGLIGAAPKHPLIHQVMGWIDDHWDPLKMQFFGRDPATQEKLVMHRTYIALTHVLKEHLKTTPGNNIVLPAGYFFAKGGISPLYSQHFFANAWAEGKNQVTINLEKATHDVLKTSKQTNRQWILIFACLGINIFMVIVVFLRKSI